MNDWSSEKQYLSEDCMCIKIHDIVLYNGCTQLNSKSPYWEGWWNSPSSSQPEFTITGVSQHMKYKTEYISPSFYTHKNGYKMRLEVYLNGLSKRAGTNVCVYFRLLFGEYDNTLTWPMSITISVMILNWCKNDAHIRSNCEIRNADIPENSISSSMRGYHTLCTHTRLLATHYKSTQYVQDDCMRIRIDKFTVRT